MAIRDVVLMRRGRAAASVVALSGLLLLINACAGPGSEAGPVNAERPPESASPSPPGVDPFRGQEVVRLDFEEGTEPRRSAQYGVLATQKPGIRAVAGAAGRGRALQFPGPCRSADRSTCTKAMVEVPDEADLSPGRRDFRYGVAVKLDADATTTGSNLMQKGFALGQQGQWKLQIDDPAGRPSCVLVGRGSDDIHQVRSVVAVADGLWHSVSCVRQASSLLITVDGAEQGRTSLPAGLLILNAAPVRLGAKSLKPDNDQFFGALDDVVMEVAAGP